MDAAHRAINAFGVLERVKNSRTRLALTDPESWWTLGLLPFLISGLQLQLLDSTSFTFLSQDRLALLTTTTVTYLFLTDFIGRPYTEFKTLESLLRRVLTCISSLDDRNYYAQDSKVLKRNETRATRTGGTASGRARGITIVLLGVRRWHAGFTCAAANTRGRERCRVRSRREARAGQTGLGLACAGFGFTFFKPKPKPREGPWLGLKPWLAIKNPVLAPVFEMANEERDAQVGLRAGDTLELRGYMKTAVFLEKYNSFL
ncbi:hypothetical protein C8R45DRAFT_922684 [Mycena sanguinolenta]|nr:hypothetical protein C8R45DRAFT_922684 [Mycena sanguinolenta]